MGVKPRILHVTAHLGGGVGKVLSAVACADKHFCHAIVCLEQTKNPHFEQICRENKIPLYNGNAIDWEKEIAASEIVQVEWWHHPLTARFLVEMLGTIPCRLVVWSHISGCNYPCLPFGFVEAATTFLFASPYSFENPTWSEQQRQWVLAHTQVVRSSGNAFDNLPPLKPHEGFCVGHVGFLGYEKLHPAFVKACEACGELAGLHFEVAGDLHFAQEMVADFARSKVANQVTYAGYITDVGQFLSGLDVFLYPLHPMHTGTTENALLEAMAMGVVPVVLNQCSEKYTVTHLKTGILADTPQQMGEAVRWLYHNPQERQRLGQAAAEEVCNHHTVAHTIQGLHNSYDSALKKQPTHHHMEQIFGKTPYEWFLSCYAGSLTHMTGVAAGASKGSVHQYADYFPSDLQLQKLRRDATNESGI